jgi:hypothetical protein
LTAIIIVIIIRALVPFTILRWQLGGALLSMAVDAVDVILVDLIGLVTGDSGMGFGNHYQLVDKTMDIYYLSFEAYVSLHWSNQLARNTSIILFVYRIIGMVAFEITGIRRLLFIFPNLFENFYLYYVVAARFFPRYAVNTPRQLVIALVLLFIPKVGQEWLLHYQEAQPWNWLKSLFLR